jgi:hypothetical protein
MELKNNIDYYKRVYGVDLIYEMVQSLKFDSYAHGFDIDAYNPTRSGY